MCKIHSFVRSLAIKIHQLCVHPRSSLKRTFLKVYSQVLSQRAPSFATALIWLPTKLVLASEKSYQDVKIAVVENDNKQCFCALATKGVEEFDREPAGTPGGVGG